MLHRFQNCPQSSSQRHPDNGVYINARLRAKRNLCLAVEVKLLWAFRTPALISLGEEFLHESGFSHVGQWDFKRRLPGIVCWPQPAPLGTSPH